MTSELVPKKARKTVSHSEVESYLRCERQHYYGYGLGIQRIGTSIALSKGTLGHSALEVYFTKMMEMQEAGEWDPDTGPMLCFHAATLWLIDSGDPLYGEVLGYLTWFFKGMPRKLKTAKIIGVEKEYSLRINDDLEYPFVVDLVVEDSLGQVTVIDHKFMGMMLTERDMELMPQLSKYLGAMRALGQRVDFVAYNQVKTKENREPTIESQYRYTEYEITDTRVRETFREQLVAADRIQRSKQHVIDEPETGLYDWSQTALRVANKMVCNSCSFRSLCVAELNGEDAEYVLDAEYAIKKRREIPSQKVLEIEE